MTKVITYGTFDLFHQGHYNLLKRAKALGDYLIVGVTSEHFDENRGKINVVEDVLTRVQHVKDTGFADQIIIEDHEGQKIEDIQRYEVDIFTVGSDWVGTFDYLNQFCKVVYLPRTPDISSTAIRSNMFQPIRIGIVGTGRMAPRFMSESKYISGAQIIAAYNSDKNTETLEVCQKSFPSLLYETKNYEKFLENIDAVYIASPNETHFDYAKRALLAGRHVLSEKPLAFTKHETQDLYNLAESKELVLLEAVKAAYSPGFQELINVATSGKIGEIVDIEADFTRLATADSRERTDAKYGGAFYEFGPSVLVPIIKLLGTNYRDISFHSIFDENGVDIYDKMEIYYDRAMASARTGVAVKTEGQLVISGTKGYILAQSPWWLMKHFEVRYEDASKIESYDPPFRGDGLRYEISEFIRKIAGLSRNGYKLTAKESIVMAEIIEKYSEYKKTAFKNK
ncbi:MAG: Gfo/Idh/MocA family oxidoreductase [Eubacterium sp.]|uniref:Adenylyltransferase/cytidyltransferase family protein n=1 Tax=Candidatus Weimeria bifida TaxID=2599074 RepID=A0A6N7IZF4_9FIRM|nr:Gfo/Idh/MocA family oxidoreductase [Eubacterium sp.]MQN01728.1 adenylyltransferase/cytidyltransferase family protein [Candidatus Weimeria bifida]RRF94634.1 MAG: glycerol-3-phosphate cytidylyltransferase [Lachnospiraceae bacterium]